MGEQIPRPLSFRALGPRPHCSPSEKQLSACLILPRKAMVVLTGKASSRKAMFGLDLKGIGR